MSTFIVSSHEIPPAGPAGLNRTLQPRGLYFILLFFLSEGCLFSFFVCFFLRVEKSSLAVEGSVKRTRGRRTESEKKKASEESGTTAAPADDRLTGRLRLRLHRRISLQVSGLSVKKIKWITNIMQQLIIFKKFASNWQRCVWHLICK